MSPNPLLNPLAEDPSSSTLETPAPSITVHGNAIQGDAIHAEIHSGQQGAIAVGKQITQIIHQYRRADDPLDEAEFESQLAGYLRWVIERTKTIELRGVTMRDGSQIAYLELADVYVTLQAEVVGTTRRDEPKEIALDHLLRKGDRLAVVGGPGCGKTTVSIYIAWVLAKAILENRPAWAQETLGLRLDQDQPILPLPIYLPLSAYARQRFHPETHRTGGEQSLPDFLSHYLRGKHSSIDRLPADFFSRLLNKGRHVILLLDGLDEVADEGERRLVREAIENLVTSREQIRVVVTCRTVAYQGRSVLARGFRQVNVQPLGEEQVALLVRKAYECVYRQDEREQRLKTEELLAGIEKLEAEQTRRTVQEKRRLVDSPLMVRMLLVVHLSDRKLPQHRAELYKRFCETILQSDHAFDEEVAEELRKLAGNNAELMRALAFGMHQRGDQQGREIDDETLRQLLKVDFANEVDAFVRLTRRRGTLVEERDGLYRFLHLAFQEYLAAAHLVDDYGVDEGFAAKIRFFSEGEILNSWWREVALLVPGYLSMGKRQQAYRFVRMLAGLGEWQTTADGWSPDVQLASVEVASTAALEWMPDDVDLLQRLAHRIITLFERATFTQTKPTLRAMAGRALAGLGDPRFRADAWFLPDDPMLGFIEIPAGTFIMGSDPAKDKAAEKREMPQHQLYLPTYYIARYPVTGAQFRAFVEATGEKISDEDALRDPDNHPVRYITWYEATRYCAWLDKTLRAAPHTLPVLAEKLRQGWRVMLPSEAEWEKAARGPSGQLYPWPGDSAPPHHANGEESGIGSPSTVGCFPDGTSPYKVEEMMGNVWEWTRSLYQPYPYPAKEKARRERERLEGQDSVRFVLRGSSYYGKLISLRCAFRNRNAPDSWTDNYGFRVVLSPSLC